MYLLPLYSYFRSFKPCFPPDDEGNFSKHKAVTILFMLSKTQILAQKVLLELCLINYNKFIYFHVPYFSTQLSLSKLLSVQGIQWAKDLTVLEPSHSLLLVPGTGGFHTLPSITVDTHTCSHIIFLYRCAYTHIIELASLFLSF